MIDNYKQKAIDFVKDMPYKKEPYNHRNWGHPWHSLCSYHGKLKPAIAHMLISNFTEPGDVVLDPMSGVGTIPFEACLQGRMGIGNDLSQLAYIVTKAKLEMPILEDSLRTVEELTKYIESNNDSEYVDEMMEHFSNFGYNGKLESYFEPNTYREVLLARKFFLDKFDTLTSSDAMVYSCFLHVLHGNRPYALSRNSHPLTPYAPKGDFIYKNVGDHITDKVKLSYKKSCFESFSKGRAIFGDYSKLSNELPGMVDEIICSPPFAGSIRFYMQNWMRLWLCGWDTPEFSEADGKFLDKKQSNNFDLYFSFFSMCAKVLKPHGKVILHLGKTNKIDMAEELSKRAVLNFKEIYRGNEPVLAIENHGIKDHSATIDHEFLFLEKR